MKKSIQNKLMVLFVVLIFGMSSIAYIFASATNFGAPAETEMLNDFIVQKEVSPDTESLYIQNGFTFVKYYYSQGSLKYYLETLPNDMTTNTGQQQIIVVEVESNNSEEKVIVSNLNGEFDVQEITEKGVFQQLCESLLIIPPQCIMEQLNKQNQTINTTKPLENQTISINTTTENNITNSTQDANTSAESNTTNSTD